MRGKGVTHNSKYVGWGNKWGTWLMIYKVSMRGYFRHFVRNQRQWRMEDTYTICYNLLIPWITANDKWRDSQVNQKLWCLWGITLCGNNGSLSLLYWMRGQICIYDMLNALCRCLNQVCLKPHLSQISVGEWWTKIDKGKSCIIFGGKGGGG